MTSLIGATGYRVNGLESYNGVLYGTTSQGDPNFNGLITINTSTGAGTPVGSGWGPLPDDTFVDLAIDSTGNAYSWLESSIDDLYSIDLTTGTHIALIGDSDLGTWTFGMAFDASDTLWFINADEEIATISTVDGSANVLHADWGDNYAHHGSFDPTDNTYWGLEDDNQGSENVLRQVDLAAGTLTQTVTLDRRIHALAFDSVVPEPSSIAMFGIGALGLFGYGRRRRQTSAAA